MSLQISLLENYGKFFHFPQSRQIFNCIPNELASILSWLINSTFETGIFPEALKIVKVIPIYKNKGSNLETNNYRPISLLSNVDKIFEKLVHKHLFLLSTIFFTINNLDFGDLTQLFIL